MILVRLSAVAVCPPQTGFPQASAVLFCKTANAASEVKTASGCRFSVAVAVEHVAVAEMAEDGCVSWMLKPVPNATPPEVCQETFGVAEQFVDVTCAVRVDPRAPKTSMVTVGGGGAAGDDEPPQPAKRVVKPTPTKARQMRFIGTLLNGIILFIF